MDQNIKRCQFYFWVIWLKWAWMWSICTFKLACQADICCEMLGTSGDFTQVTARTSPKTAEPRRCGRNTKRGTNTNQCLPVIMSDLAMQLEGDSDCPQSQMLPSDFQGTLRAVVHHVFPTDENAKLLRQAHLTHGMDGGVLLKMGNRFPSSRKDTGHALQQCLTLYSSAFYRTMAYFTTVPCQILSTHFLQPLIQYRWVFYKKHRAGARVHCGQEVCNLLYGVLYVLQSSPSCFSASQFCHYGTLQTLSDCSDFWSSLRAYIKHTTLVELTTSGM